VTLTGRKGFFWRETYLKQRSVPLTVHKLDSFRVVDEGLVELVARTDYLLLLCLGQVGTGP
jgi:hypothetical protein